MCATELFNLLAIHTSILNRKTSLQRTHQDNQIPLKPTFFAQNLPKPNVSENSETVNNNTMV